jgi:peptide/nickel transport system ATP-binding protein
MARRVTTLFDDLVDQMIKVPSTPYESPTKSLLEIRDLVVTLPTATGRVTALQSISLDIAKGESLGLIGESGSGKSLTALAVMGLLPERADVKGSIAFHGQELLGLTDEQLCQYRGARMAMIFQEPMTALNPLHPIWHQVAEPLLRHQKITFSEAKDRALTLLERVQLPRASERLGAYPHELSGGQRQRVMIASALACGPDLLIADEPTTALDVTVQKEVLELIKQLVNEDQMSLLLISHDLGLMQDQVDRIAVMYGGCLVEMSKTEDLFALRAHPYTRGLFAARPRLGMRRGERLTTIRGSVPSLADLPSGCGFADRCEKVVDACRVSRPPLVPLIQDVGMHAHKADQSGSIHRVACPRWDMP